MSTSYDLSMKYKSCILLHHYIFIKVNHMIKSYYLFNPLWRFSSGIGLIFGLSTVDTTSLRLLGETEPKVLGRNGPSVFIMSHNDVCVFLS